MLRPTFSGFEVARSGINASQKSLDVTGQNITNINTEGYTRQRLDLNSIPESSGIEQYSSNIAGVGRGVQDLGPSQIRNEFLDIRYREQVPKVGEMDILESALSDLEDIFDEITTDGLDSKLSYLKSQFQALSQTPGDAVIEGVVKTASTMVTQLFNDYANEIDVVASQQREYLQDSAVPDVNNLLSNIAVLNDEIKRENIHGDPALELNDNRNLLIDQLSEYMNVSVVRTSVDIGVGQSVEELSIVNKDVTDGSGNYLVLVDNDEYAQVGVDYSDTENIRLNLTKSIDPNFVITTDASSTPAEIAAAAAAADITDDTDTGKLAGYLKFNNNKAEFVSSNDVSVENRGYQYYSGMLDQVANTFANAFNSLNCTDTDGDGTVDPTVDIPKNLFEAEGGGTITAANIKISDDWRNSNETYIVNSIETSVGDDNTAANDNILRMIAEFDVDKTFASTEVGFEHNLFKGTLQGCLSHTSTTLGLQINNTNSNFENYTETLTGIDTMRKSTSSVSLDEEGINLLKYNKSYSAASRLMTTLDEALDVLINSTGRVGL